MINKNKKTFLFLGFIFILLIIMFLVLQENNNYPFKDKHNWVNAEEKAMSIDKNKFINYSVSKRQTNSKELIAVVFNTDNDNNLGFIDEYGNVIKEPFLKANNYDYYERLRGEVGIDSYFDKYYCYSYIDENNKSQRTYYDENFNIINLSSDEQEEYSKNKSKWHLDTKEINEQEFKTLKGYLDKIIKQKYVTHDYNIGYTGDMYDINFAYDNRGYHILMNDKFELVTQLYFPDSTNLNAFASPNNGSIVGNFFAKDFGTVYYNTNGEIIWITYCK